MVSDGGQCGCECYLPSGLEHEAHGLCNSLIYTRGPPNMATVMSTTKGWSVQHLLNSETFVTHLSCTNMDSCINPVFQLQYLLLIVHGGAQAHRVKMQRWAFGLECPSFKTIDKINKVKYVSSLFWLCSCSWSIPSSKLLQLSSVTAALSPRGYTLHHCLPLSKLKSLAKHTTCCYLSGKPALKNSQDLTQTHKQSYFRPLCFSRTNWRACVSHRRK